MKQNKTKQNNKYPSLDALTPSSCNLQEFHNFGKNECAQRCEV